MNLEASGIRIVVHGRPESYSDRWIEEGRRRGYDMVEVDAYRGDIVDHLRGADALLWHWANWEPRGFTAAVPILRAAEEMGVAVFPNLNTGLHYDDKLAQAFMFDAVDAPAAKTHSFLDRSRALEWARRQEDWPKVFKLRRGSNSNNVKMVRTKRQAIRLINRMFGPGINPVETPTQDLGARLTRAKTSGGLVNLLRRAPRGVMKLLRRRRSMPRERDYILFQEFLPGNEFDTRVLVIGGRAFTFRRFNRPGDFRASGSGYADFDPKSIDPRCVRVAFDLSRRFGFQAMNYDILFDRDGDPVVVEMGYAAPTKRFRESPGWWDEELNWHDEPGLYTEDLIMDQVISEVLARRNKGDGPRES